MKRFFLVLLIYSALVYSSNSDTIDISLQFGEFSDASSISASRGEFIFIADAGSNKIMKFNAEGKLLGEYGGTGLGINGLNQPVSVDATNGLDIFICDYLNNRIVRLDEKLTFVSIFDFNFYNTNTEISKRVYNPKSITSMSTGELFLLYDAGNYKGLRLREFSDVSIYFAKTADRVLEPVKIVKGISLDAWVFDISSNELLNFNSFGILVKRLNLPDSLYAINITYSEQYIIILCNGKIINYDLKKGNFAGVHYFSNLRMLRDLVLLDKETLFILQKNTVSKFKIK